MASLLSKQLEDARKHQQASQERVDELEKQVQQLNDQLEHIAKESEKKVRIYLNSVVYLYTLNKVLRFTT